MTFKEAYESCPHGKTKEWRDNIALQCGVEEGTVYSWLRGNEPFKLAKEKISEILNIPVEQLFPPVKK